MSDETASWCTGSSSGSNPTNRAYSTHKSDSSGDSLLKVYNCGKEAVVRTSWTNTNPGRRFRGYPGNRSSYCGSFQWVDPPMCRRSQEIIPGLLRCMSNYENMIKRAAEQVEELECSCCRLRRLLLLLRAIDQQFGRRLKYRHCLEQVINPLALAYRCRSEPVWDALRVIFGPSDNVQEGRNKNEVAVDRDSSSEQTVIDYSAQLDTESSGSPIDNAS
ncbi:hypothetical protein Salat_0176600 [Sesamum alatum]|uniref:Zinc finger GRF-type domain-containing protein n=1 Tax=Sesamum alatum TaxID=300844 RepID=A0AAE2CXS6_9LAMI|nr:hypothetical protein Salat_0176600 [Sesamum alatum]